MPPARSALRRAEPPDRTRTTRLRLECLEDRSVPATFNVTTTLDVVDPADGKRSLREAITAANNLAGADVIVVPAGVYKLTGGELAITSAVTFAGAGAGRTVVDGQQLTRVFDILGTGPSSIKVVFQGLTVRNGNTANVGGGILVGNADLVVRDSVVTGNRASGNGGGISNTVIPGTGNVKLVRGVVSRNVSGENGGGIAISGNSVLTVKNSTIRRNITALSGGGINGTTATLSGSTLSGNFAGEDGGGILADTTTLTNCTVSGNTAGSSRGGIPPVGVGGGIAATTASLTGSTVNNNSAGIGGGGINASTATLTCCTVSENVAGSDGGGINAGTATLTNSTLSGNSAWNAGGGLRSTIATTLTNSTLSGNSAGTLGGGVWAHAATLLNVTVVENNAASGGGAYFDARTGGAFAIRNSLIALNLIEFGGSGPDISGDFTSQGHNLIGDGTGGTGFTNGVNGDIVGTSLNPIDPELGPLTNNGGQTKTHKLLAGSPAIDTGDNGLLPPTDQRGPGFPRKKDGNGDGKAIVDIGAFER